MRGAQPSRSRRCWSWSTRPRLQLRAPTSGLLERRRAPDRRAATASRSASRVRFSGDPGSHPSAACTPALGQRTPRRCSPNWATTPRRSPPSRTGGSCESTRKDTDDLRDAHRGLLPVRAAAARAGAGDPAPGPRLFRTRGCADRGRLLGAGGVPVRAHPGFAELGSLGRARRPAGARARAPDRLPRDGDRPGRRVDEQLLRGALRPGDGRDRRVRHRRAARALAAADGAAWRPSERSGSPSRTAAPTSPAAWRPRPAATATSGCSTATSAGSATAPSPTSS